ncbi:MAG: SDR family oxidoreductase, partial [Alphaproteobacteria bacterium]|nr:SDR family oxidoreductase [Alphaproteobacteria bacterium]
MATTDRTPEGGAALVTGAGRRIGRAIALDLAAQGWRVAVHHNRSADDAAAVVAEIEASGGRAVTLGADLSAQVDVEELVPRAAEQLGWLDCLINSAALFDEDSIDTVSRESWERHMGTNLWAPLALSQTFARQLPPAAEGNIVNIIDQRVWNLTPHFLSYTVSKSGLWTLTRTLALALAPRVRVNAVGPGPTLASTRQSEKEFARQCARTPLGRGTT